MLQFICEQTTFYSTPELAQMAIEGGCTWIQLRLPESAVADVSRETLADLVAICREASAFLIFEDQAELAREMGVHGVHINHGGLAKAIETRELLGPEAVIGVELATATDIDAAQRADIDYVSLPVSMPMERAAQLIAYVRASAIAIPIVANGCNAPSEVPAFMAAGYNGLAIGTAISEAADPVACTKEFIEALTNS